MFRKTIPLATLPALALAACSGGGGGSGGGVATTPPAATAPTPTPSASASPTPTPAIPNTSLLDPKTSESFVNDAASGTASYPLTGAAGTSNAAPATLTVSYDAAAGSYAITTAGRSQTFLPSDRDAAQSSGAVSVFIKTNGSTTDSLTLNKPSATPGTLAYRYVGLGFWQRTVEGAGTISGSFDAFTYGVKTPDAATPRTGAANYPVDLIGIVALPNEVRSVAGSGTLQADFLNGFLRVDGTARELDSATGAILNPNMIFYGQANMSSSTNGFGGTFRYHLNGTPIRSPFDGTMTGRFYGPAAEEVGATFAARNDLGSSLLGTLTGARSSTPTSNLSLTNMVANQRFDMPSINYNREYSAFYGFSIQQWLQYTAATQSWMFQPKNLATDSLPSFGPASRNAALSNARYTVYDTTNANGTYRLTLYNPGAGNDQLALSYTSFGTWDGAFTMTPGPGPLITGSYYFAFGQKTPSRFVPTTGTASYAGVIFGTTFNGSGGRSYTLGGSSRFELNFGTNAFSVTLSPTGVERTSGAAVNFGSYTYTGTGIGSDMYGRDAYNNTRFQGFLAGPNGEEVAGTFALDAVDPFNPSSTLAIFGATAAKRCTGSC